MKKYMYVWYEPFSQVAFFRDEKWEELQFFLWEIHQARERYGGSFLKTLSVLLACADSENEKKIMDTWNNYIIQYYQQWFLQPYQKKWTKD